MWFCENKTESKKIYNTAGTALKSNRKILERGKIDIPDSQIRCIKKNKTNYWKYFPMTGGKVY